MMPSNIKAALASAVTSADDITYTLYRDGIDSAHHGEVKTSSFAELAQFVEASAISRWPADAELIDTSERIREYIDDDEQDDAYDAAVKDAKKNLPVVVWASITRQPRCSGGQADCVHRCDDGVEWISALFVDLDKGFEISEVAALRKLLDESGINYVATESATSRLQQLNGNCKPPRFHFYVPIRPLVLPSSAAVPRRDVKAWWQRLYKAVVTALALAADLQAFDASVDDLAQPIFVPSTPPGSAVRTVKKKTDGMALDLEAFVAALGVDVMKPQPAGAKEPASKAPATATSSSTSPTSSTSSEPAASTSTCSQGPTPGHSTGSLLMLAFKALGRLGNCLDAASKKWAVQCPWCEGHSSDPRQKLGQFNSSTVIYDDVGKYGFDGGFECKHDGHGVVGECKQATAADVLRWARKKLGDALPNRPDFEGGGDVKEVDDGDVVQPKKTKSKDSRPCIVVSADVAGMRDQAIVALKGRCDIFVRDGVLVDLTPAGPRTLPADHLLAVLGETARWVKVSRNEEGERVEKAAKPPRDVVNAVLKAPHWPGIPELRAVVKHPPLLPDGRLIVQPGYDAESKLLYLPDVDFTIPSKPSRDDAVAAKERLLGYVRHTNFCDANGSSVWLSFVLTLATRTAVPTVPIVGFDAAVAGAGKTSLVKIAYGLIYGELPQLGAPVVDDDAEAEKRLPTWARQPLVCWDNVKAVFGSPVVDGAITAGKATTRRLGANESMTFDFTSTSWCMTGNNLVVGDDAASRCIIARIQAPTTRRYDFAVDDVAFYAAHRPKAVADALTILNAFIAAGSPQREGVPYCRFVEWSRLIRQALLWLGMADPVGAEVVDSSLEAKGIAIRAIGIWQRWRKAVASGGNNLTEDQFQGFTFEPFFAGDIDTSPLRLKSEDDDTYRSRRAVVDALVAVYGKRVEGAVRVGHALQKLRDAEVPADNGGSVRFVVEKVGAKTVYRLAVDQ